MQLNISKLWIGLILALIMSLLFKIESAYAHASLNYEQWKAKQERHDIRLKQQTHLKSIQQRVVQVEPIQPLLTNRMNQQSSNLGESITVNVNTATTQELTAKLDGIGRKKAQAIIDYRQQHGTFKKKEDLLNVKGIGVKTLEKNKDRIRLN